MSEGKSSLAPNEQIVESHEGRILRLEDGVQELSSGLAANNEKLESLNVRIDEGFSRISEKIDNCIAPLSDKLKDHINEDFKVVSKIDNLVENLDTQNDKIKDLEESEIKRIKRLAKQLSENRGIKTLKVHFVTTV